MFDFIRRLDREAFIWLNSLGSETWDGFWLFVTGKFSFIPLYLLLLLLLFKKTGWRKTIFIAFLIIVLIFFSDQFSILMKYGFKRPRPCHEDFVVRFIAVRCGPYGFPSAHSLSSMALAVFLGKIFKPHYKYGLPALIIWSLIVGYSRVYLGVHYPGDLIAGFLVGALSGYVFYKLYAYSLVNFEEFDSKKIEFQKIYGRQGFMVHKYWDMVLAVFLIIAFILYLKTEVHSETFVIEGTSLEFYYESFALLVSIVGLFIRMYTIGHMPEEITVKNMEKDCMAYKEEMAGVYTKFRYALFWGSFLMFLGPVLWTRNIWFIVIFCFFYFFYYHRVVYTENKFLKERFGEACEEEIGQVPRHLPEFRYSKNFGLPFSFKKVLLRERMSVFSTFLIFTGFNILGEIFKPEGDYNYFVLIVCVLGAVNYFILSFFVKKGKGIGDS